MRSVFKYNVDKEVECTLTVLLFIFFYKNACDFQVCTLFQSPLCMNWSKYNKTYPH